MPFDLALQDARGGSEPALGTLMESCRGYITAVATRQVPHRLRARVRPSSLVQETYLRACKDFGRFRGQSERQFLAWLRQIMLHCIINLLRRPEFRASVVGLPADTGHPGPGPDRQAADGEAAGLIGRALDRLPTHYRLAVELRHFDGLGFREIGDVLGCTEEAARKVWARAQAKLGAELRSLQ